MDFYEIVEQLSDKKTGAIELSVDFPVNHSKDLMVRGKSFYAVWDEKTQMWSQDVLLARELIDEDLRNQCEKKKQECPDVPVKAKYLLRYSNGSWNRFLNFLASMPDNAKQLDMQLTFANTKTKRTDYVSKRLEYSLEEGDIGAYEELISTLYSPEERAKIEWAIGSIVSGDSKTIQKFYVFYGGPGTGKSTVMEIIESLFSPYTISFDASALANKNNQFSTEVFRDNPLVAIQGDGNLSRLEENSVLNGIVSHDTVSINPKGKPHFDMRVSCALFMGTNSPVRITDGKSGLIRRLIDIHPSGKKLSFDRYTQLREQIQYERGAIAYHCLQVFKSMGKNYYANYIPIDMMARTDPFFNFVKEQYELYSKEDGVSLKAAWEAYKMYGSDANLDHILKKFQFREELKNYFETFEEMTRVDGIQVRNWYSGFKREKFEVKSNTKPKATLVPNDILKEEKKDEEVLRNVSKEPEKVEYGFLKMDQTESILDDMLQDCTAQYASKGKNEVPLKAWDNVKTTLKDLDTKQTHYILPPDNMIVFDFDLRDINGEKSQDLNLKAASKYYPTYAEFSKSGCGVHLHYIYSGDVTKLAAMLEPGVEVKTFTGKSALRRKLTKCNSVPVAHISGGIPLKEEKRVIESTVLKTEKALRAFIVKNLQKRIHSSTKQSIDFIRFKLDEVYEQGWKYDVSDMRSDIFEFACGSTHNSDYCIKQVGLMKFKSEEPSLDICEDKPIAFFDCEVFPNLFLINWKLPGKEQKCVRMINPKPSDVENLVTSYRLIGYNNRRYDNTILYARIMGYTNEQLFDLSQQIIAGGKGSDIEKQFTEAKNISYTDIYDFASAANKTSLKKLEYEMGVTHKELGYRWDQPVPEDKWEEVALYCDNDVISTEAAFHYLEGDWKCRQMLAALAKKSVNESTNNLAATWVFGDERNPQKYFYYRNLAEPVTSITQEQREFYERYFPDMIAKPHYAYGKDSGGPASILPYFPGYTKNEKGVSLYRGYEVGEGGFVWAKPGDYRNVWAFDVTSMHPHSALSEFIFGKYCEMIIQILHARVAIKHKDFDKARSMLDGVLAPYLDNEDLSKAVSDALKTVINSMYGQTAAHYSNKFKDPRNVDNIVAKRGALFMVDLLEAVIEAGGEPVHIKTDCIKIVDPSPEIVDLVMSMGKQYGYNFEVEHIFEKFCLVNNAVYIAKMDERDEEWISACKKAEKKGEKKPTRWIAVGAQFAHPFVFKTLFDRRAIEFEDMCEVKSVSTAIYLDFNENDESDHNYVFVGKVGQFCPVKPGTGGGIMCRQNNDKFDAVGGSKGYRWKESEIVKSRGLESTIDRSYFMILVNKALETIAKFGSVDDFLDEHEDVIPWSNTPCGTDQVESCESCPYCTYLENGTYYCKRDFIIHPEYFKNEGDKQ